MKKSISSIKTIITKEFIFLTLTVIAITIAMTVYFSHAFQKQYYDFMKQTLNSYCEQIDAELMDAMTYLSENCSYNSDITSLNTSVSASEIYLHTTKIKKLLSLSSYTFSHVSGLFIYSQPTQTFIPQVNDVWDLSHNNTLCCEKIRVMIERADQSDELDALVKEREWSILECENDYYLVWISKKTSTYMGVFINLQKLTDKLKYFTSKDAEIFFIAPDGTGYGGPDYHFPSTSLLSSQAKPVYFRSSMFTYWLIVSDQLKRNNYFIVSVIPMKRILHELVPFYLMFILLFILLITYTAINYSFLKKLISSTIDILKQNINLVRKENFNKKITINPSYSEIQAINSVINEMIGVISNLRIREYEDRIAAKEMELRYLRTQIAPHFLINCLNTIFVLAQDRANINTTRQVIETLSDHLRYTLATRKTVSLRNELDYVQNYMKLTALRFPDTLSYDIQCEEDIKDACVFPFILLMLTENSIKANLTMGEPFFIQIRCTRVNESLIHLTHIDSGSGLKQQEIDYYNHIMEQNKVGIDGYGIGIYNIVRRLHLLMNDRATIAFSNEPDMGARIDISIPYKKYNPKNEVE